MLNPSMVDYQVPTAPEVPMIEAKLHALASDDPTHPLHNKGIGESGVTPAAAAIANAVHDAIGAPVTSLPLTPEKVLAALRRRQAADRGASRDGAEQSGAGQAL
jgi:CO/xanthine dehydrogenase Mo-binding subunit